MAFWSADLTTRDGAESATSVAGMACFVMAGLGFVGTALMVGITGGGSVAQSLPLVCAAGAEIVLFVVAGFRFRAGRGLIWGIAAAAMLVFEILVKLVAFSAWGGIVVNVIVLVVIVNGIRGAWAMRRGFPNYDAEAEIFS